MSLTVSLYSGANVAHVSTPPADQIMSQIQTRAICKPPQARPGSFSLYVRFAESKSPFRNGRTMKTKSGIIRSRPGQVVERHREARPEEVADPDEEDDPDRDQVLEPDVDAAGRMLK